jgi:hypothetical protein
LQQTLDTSSGILDRGAGVDRGEGIEATTEESSGDRLWQLVWKKPLLPFDRHLLRTLLEGEIPGVLR